MVQKLGTIREELFDECLRIFNIDVQKDFFFELAQKHFAQKRYVEAGNIIFYLDFMDKFDLEILCCRLAEKSETLLLRKILDKRRELLPKVVEELSTKENVKLAAKIVKDYKLNASDFKKM